MAIKNHPMAGMKGSPEAKALMAQVSAHRGGKKPPAAAARPPRARAGTLPSGTLAALLSKGVAGPMAGPPAAANPMQISQEAQSIRLARLLTSKG
jgi:hypothetical protein